MADKEDSVVTWKLRLFYLDMQKIREITPTHLTNNFNLENDEAHYGNNST